MFRDVSYLPCLTKLTVSESNVRCMSAVPGPKPEGPKTEPNSQNTDDRKPLIPDRYRFKYPDLLPLPKMEWRNAIREKLERRDQMARRSQIDIPEFYVGSVLAVYQNNRHAADKKQKFVGICTQRDGYGLRANFVLRNVIDHIGMEIRYLLYDPTIEKIEVLRLEKRLDENLLYLKDAPPEHSTFPLDMEPEFIAEDEPVPINPVQVKLKPKPWRMKWEKWGMKGIAPDSFFPGQLKGKIPLVKPWDEMDLMKQYRQTIPEEEQQEIYAELYTELHQQDASRKRTRRKDSKKKK